LKVTTAKEYGIIKKKKEGLEIYQEVCNSVFNFGILRLILASG